MGAIKKKPGLQSSNHFFNRYSGVPVIYVESEEDRYIYGGCWFQSQLSRVEFLSVAERAVDNAFSGCKAVIEAVQEEASSGNVSWGIVDRDAVMSQDLWSLVHETDDDCFDGSRPFGQHIKVLLRWEMESYLVDAGALELLRSRKEMTKPRPDHVVWDELLGDCQALIPHAALNAMRHQYKEKGLGDGSTDDHKNRPEVECQLVNKVLDAMKMRKPDCDHDYAEHLAYVEAFDTIRAPSYKRVQGFLRRVHGKAVLSRFKKRHSVKDDFRAQLAVEIKAAGRVPKELDDFVWYVVNK
ncbi:MAG: hypothetical protein RLZZ352_1809 [Pseudomonadota bacterium]|jgi:hypothetical protein